MEKTFNGNSINFLSQDNDLMADVLDRGIIRQAVNKRSALLKRFKTLLDDVLVTDSDR